jgi:hypothetical protein
VSSERFLSSARRTTVRIVDLIVPTNGVWVCVADATCEIFAPGFIALQPNHAAFISEVIRLAKSGELLKQEVVLDGSFRFRIIVLDPDDEVSNLAYGERHTLRLPSGILELRTGDLLAHPEWRIAVPSGTYDAWIQWSVDEECKHYEIASAEHYPAGDGPDGIIVMRRATG